MRGPFLAIGLWALVSVACTGDEVPAPAPQVAEVRARLRGIEGSVMVKRAAGDDWIAAVDEMELYENDKVRTAPGASTQVVFSGGSQVVMGPEALIAVAETRVRPGKDRTDLTVLRGRIAAELEHASQSLSVTTPSATVRAGREIVFQ